MSLYSFINRTSAVVVALVVSISLPSRASTPVYAQLGLVSVGGSLTSGGDLNYKFDVEVSTNVGTLVVNATIIGKKFKANFPVLTITNPVLGVSEDVPGPFVHIPTNFTGNAVVHVTAAFNKKKIGSQTLLVAITAPLPPAPLTVTTNLYDVGFENAVALNGSIVPTSGMTGTLTYAWSQTGGNTVTLSTNAGSTTSFTTDALTNFVTMTDSPVLMNFPDIEGVVTNLVYAEPEHRFGTFEGVAMDNEQATAATYTFRLLVSNASVTRTGLFTVSCSSQTPAHPNIPLGVTAYVKGATNSLNWTLVSKPTGSAATLTHTNSLIPQLRPDVQGVYVIQDNVTSSNVTVTAAGWTGVQFCAICHGPDNNVGEDDIVTPWSQTLHATMAQRGVDGLLSSHYNESCFQCHTVGFNKSPAATNGNFYAVQQQLGWPFPAVLQAGNYAAMPDQLKNVANIQCESCHGPGSRHPGSPSISLDLKVCSQCHQDGSNHFHPQQWEVSPHAGTYEQISENEGTRSPCSRCHSPQGFIDEAKRLTAGVPLSVINSNTVTGTGPLTCQACHDPHDAYGNPARHQLRVFDSVILGDPSYTNTIMTDITGAQAALLNNLAVSNSNVTVTNIGDIAACTICHNARRHAENLNGTTGKKYYQNSSPHDSPIAESFLGIGCVDYGTQMGNSFHTYLAECTDCHMYALRAPTVTGGVTNILDQVNVGGVVQPVDAATYAKYSNVLGSHTFSMTFIDGTNEVQNIAACNQCHNSFEPVQSFDFKSAFGHDYDGNGSIDGVQTEIGTGALADINPTNGLLNMVIWKMEQSGMTVSANTYGLVDGFGGYATNSVPISEAQHKAAWNVLVIRRDGSQGVHNTQFAVRLLQTTYTDLSTNTGGGTFIQEHPAAFLR